MNRAGAEGDIDARLPSAARWVLASALITNIGNGMHRLTMGKMLDDHTGSAAAFGSVIVVEYIATFLLQLLAGSVVDRGTPKPTCFTADILRAAFICIATLQLSSGNMYW